MRRAEFLRAIDDYLASKGASLWADWEISQPERRRLAAEWLMDEIQGLREHMRERAS